MTAQRIRDVERDARPRCRWRSLWGSWSIALLAVRLYASGHIGFGDSEALYACYALHPQPAYLDHPGLIGLVARAIAGGTSLRLEPRTVTALLATLLPWLVVLAARLAGAAWRGLVAGLAVAAAPEVSRRVFSR